MKQKFGASLIFALMFFSCMSITVYANSSWHWFTKTPFTILPWAIIFTLVTEIVVICCANHISRVLKPTMIILLANMISFLLPYIFVGLFPEMGMERLSPFDRIDYYVNALPFYTVNIAFLILTLIAEIPIVYNLLKKKATSRKHLFISVFIVNCITTLGVAVVERILYQGSW